MKKLFAGIITCATILLTGIGVSAAAADENNSGDENVQSEIVFVWNGFDECYAGNTDNPPELYKGYFVERNGNVRSFSFEDVNEHWTFGYISMEDIPKTISLNQTTPQEKLLSHLTDISKYQIVGKISEEELERNLNLLSDINTNVNIKMDISPLDVVQGYSETFGLRYDDNGKAEVVFLNGMGTIINKHTDENALEIDSWLRNLDISSDNPNTEITTQPNPTENTTTTTVTTTEVIPSTEPSKTENEQSEIVFCIVNSEQTGRTSYSYGGFFIENNGNVRTFSFENIEDDWTLIWGSDYYNDDNTVSLDGSMPHEKLLSRLNGNISEYKIVGNISEEEYNSQISLLSEIKVDTEIPFVPFQTARMTSYTESFGVNYDDDDNAQIVFMNGHVSGDMKYRTYLENPDEKSIELNNWLIEKCMSFMSSEPITTTTTVTPDVTTTTTVTTTEVIPSTEPSKTENEQSEIVFVEIGFDECYVGNTDYPLESYKGYFVERNGNIRSFSFEDVNEHWTFGYVSTEDIPKTISLNQMAPQEKLLSHLTDISKYQIVGKISEEELERNLNLLSDIDTNVDIKMDISPLDIVQGYSETFGLRYDDNGHAEVVFLNGIGTIINKHTDENALEIDNWLRNLDISSDDPNTEITQPNPTENATTTTVTTTTTTTTNFTDTEIETTNTTDISETTTNTTNYKNTTEDDFIDWAKNDYQDKTGIMPANAVLSENANGEYEIMLTDENGNILDVYTVDPVTAIGTNQNGEEVNLPQTGVYSMRNLFIFFGGVLMLGFGLFMIKKSRFVRIRK